MRSNPKLTVSELIAAAIRSFLATAVDVWLSAAATAEHDDCPSSCVDIMGFPQCDHHGGILGDDVYRLYFSDIVFGGTSHVFSVTDESRDEAHLAPILSSVE